MITIESYFKFNNEFVNACDYNGVLPEDDNHLDGAIILIINGTPIITLQHWDYVIVFWRFIISEISDTLLQKETKVGFPDQPSEIKFIPVLGDRVLIHLDDKKLTSVDRKELLKAITVAAKTFFSKLIELSSNKKDVYQNQLTIVKTLEERIN
ncbi:MAG: hypothetical protein HQK53_19585 [Oligoflexia bacterium]|nr:hypothetical protein [Oligoflexia bacterium]